MNETGITFSWLGVYALSGLLGFLGGEGIYKILKTFLQRRCMGKTCFKKTKIVSEDAGGQFGMIKDIVDKNKFKPTNFDLRKDFQRK